MLRRRPPSKRAGIQAQLLQPPWEIGGRGVGAARYILTYMHIPRKVIPFLDLAFATVNTPALI